MSSASFAKREREKRLQERAAQKRERRADRATGTETEQPDETLLMERFHQLSEQVAAGAIDRDTYETERRAIFAQLGLADAFDD